jgi:hypothetical protein
MENILFNDKVGTQLTRNKNYAKGISRVEKNKKELFY